MAPCRYILCIALYAAGVRALSRSAALNSPLPSLHKMLSRPRHVLQTMSSNVQELAAHLAELQTHSTQEVSKQKEQYEEKLRFQKEESEAIERHNAAIRLHAEEIRGDSAKVRAQTVRLVQASRSIVEKVKGIRENFTDAGAVIASVLEEAQEKISRSPKLQVLQEFSEKETLQNLELDHQRRLAEIGEPIGLALLQIDDKHGDLTSKSQKDAQELVQSLMSSLGSLTEEQDVSSASLKANFDNQWQVGVKQQNALLEEQVDLNATEAREEEVNKKLHTALQHASETRSNLKERLGALRRFAQKVASRPMPEARTDKYRKQ